MRKDAMSSAAAREGELINPEGLVKVGSIRPAPRPGTLENRTVVLRWNGKTNGDHYLNRVGELIVEKIPGTRVIRLWEEHLSTASISQNPGESKDVAGKISDIGADLVIGTNAD